MTIAITAICIVLGTALGLSSVLRAADARHPRSQLCRFLPDGLDRLTSASSAAPLFVNFLIHLALLPILVNGRWTADRRRRRAKLKQNYGALLGVLALTLNAGAYISEIFRPASVDRPRPGKQHARRPAHGRACGTSSCPRRSGACCRRSATTPSRS
jgi:polar amino acid transport system permease protein